MSDWVGFSDADLKRMKGITGGNQTGTARVVKPLTGGRPKQANLGQKSQKKQTSRPSKTNQTLPTEAMLSKPIVNQEKSKKEEPTDVSSDQIPLHGKTFTPSPESTVENINNTEPEILDDVEAIKEKEKIKLEDVQRRQKEMEEKNRRKKTILSKAIAERKKRAFAESTKLVKIQAELSKLDGMLNYDVSILRDRIDDACIEFNHAQRRFEKAEAEYISAKMNLHRATEMKEELTEHLFHLIQLNEERKANKLEELMQKLELEESSELDAEKTEQSQPSSEEPQILKPVEDNKITEPAMSTQQPTTEKEADDSDESTSKKVGTKSESTNRTEKCEQSGKSGI